MLNMEEFNEEGHFFYRTSIQARCDQIFCLPTFTCSNMSLRNGKTCNVDGIDIFFPY